MEVVRTGVIGVGTFGQWHARIYAELENTRLVAVADTDEQRAREVAERYGATAYTDYRELLDREDIDAVSVVLPDHLHRDVCVAAAEAGKHIMVEKPLATSEEEADIILRAVEQCGVRLMVDFANRWNPPFVQARAAIARGEIGSPLHIHMKLNDTIWVPTSMLSWSRSSSVAWFLGSHCVDLLRWLLADEVVRLRAVSRSELLRAQGIDTPDFFLTTLEFAGGTVASLENSWVLPASNPTVYEFTADIIGSRGRIQIDTAQHGCLRLTTDATRYPDVLMFNEADGKLAGFGYLPLAHFIHCLQTGEPFAVTTADARRAVQLVATIEKSAKEGDVIAFR